jgi:hypothetical protein
MSARNSDFRGADFTEADLGGSLLGWSDLRAASFRNATLSKTHFSGARLFGADFMGASGTIALAVPADVGETAPQLLDEPQFLEWLISRGAVDVLSYVAPWLQAPPES